MKPIKNKKNKDPRYFLNESYGYYQGMGQYQQLSHEPYEEIERQEFANEKVGLDRTTQEDEDRIRDVFGSGYEIIDALNYGHVQRATETRDPNIIIPLGTTPDGAFIYAKSADDIYYRVARGYPGDTATVGGIRR